LDCWVLWRAEEVPGGVAMSWIPQCFPSGGSGDKGNTIGRGGSRWDGRTRTGVQSGPVMTGFGAASWTPWVLKCRERRSPVICRTCNRSIGSSVRPAKRARGIPTGLPQSGTHPFILCATALPASSPQERNTSCCGAPRPSSAPRTPHSMGGLGDGEDEQGKSE
jgi:hypothetical protein